MNYPRKIALGFFSTFLAACIFVACTTSQQRTAFNTLYTTETTVSAAYDGYLDQVVKGKTPTNDVPKVSRAYNQFQTGMQLAITAAQFNWTNATPSNVSALAQAVLNAIIEAQKGTK